MRLSENFELDEFTKTSTGLDNEPSYASVRNLIRLVECIMQPLRDAYGKPIVITSGYRSQRVNERVGGSKWSWHLVGMACDFTAQVPCQKGLSSDEVAILRRRENKHLFEMIQELKLPYYELIEYNDYKWIHVSFNKSAIPQQPRHTKKY